MSWRGISRPAQKNGTKKTQILIYIPCPLDIGFDGCKQCIFGPKTTCARTLDPGPHYEPPGTWIKRRDFVKIMLRVYRKIEKSERLRGRYFKKLYRSGIIRL